VSLRRIAFFPELPADGIHFKEMEVVVAAKGPNPLGCCSLNFRVVGLP
jgi:hypothetical protein